MSESNNVSSARPPVKYNPPPANSIAYATIPVKDPKRAQAFYEKVFNWKFWTAPGSSITVFFTGGDIMGTLSVVDAVDSNTSQGVDEVERQAITLYVRVDNVDETLNTILASGGEVVKSKWTEANHTELARYKDTEGNVGGILKWLI
jgi:uncharacterized protein